MTAPAPLASREHLDRARAALRLAGQDLTLWHAGPALDTPGGPTYVAAGHDAITRIDNAMRQLADARAHLIGELRRDETARAARADERPVTR
jgi:hypothetical protein